MHLFVWSVLQFGSGMFPQRSMWTWACRKWLAGVCVGGCCTHQWVNPAVSSEPPAVGDGACSEELGHGSVAWRLILPTQLLAPLLVPFHLCVSPLTKDWDFWNRASRETSPLSHCHHDCVSAMGEVAGWCSSQSDGQKGRGRHCDSWHRH